MRKRGRRGPFGELRGSGGPTHMRREPRHERFWSRSVDYRTEPGKWFFITAATNNAARRNDRPSRLPLAALAYLVALLVGLSDVLQGPARLTHSARL